MLTEGMLASLVPFCLAACLLVVVVLRTMRRAGRKTKKSPFRQVKDAKAAFDKAEPNKDFPLLDADPRQRKWQAEIHDLTREASAQIDTKIALLNATIRLADQKINQLKQVQKEIQTNSDNNNGTDGDGKERPAA